MAGIKPWSGKLVFLAFALVLFLLGTNFVAGEIAPMSKVIVMLTAAAILFIEAGLKKLTSLSKETVSGMSIKDWITLALIIVLVIVALGGMVWNVPAFIQGISEFAIIVSALWIAVEAFF